MQPHSPTTRPGFTLVELLMVIIIIGILAGLLIVAVGPAIGTANTAVVKAEINQLDVALNNYRDTYGSLPPTMVTWGDSTSSPFSGNSTVESLYDENQKQQRFVRHVRKAFPRYRADWLGMGGTIYNVTKFPKGGSYVLENCDLKTMDAAEALVFWLGGMPKIWKANDEEYEVELTGFSKDPANPFLPEYDWVTPGPGTVGTHYQPERTPPLFEFDTRRLVDTDKDGWPEYVPDLGGSSSDAAPYVYFDAGTYGIFPYYPPNNHPMMASASTSWGIARPYLIRYTSTTNDLPLPASYAAADAFQIICAGADGKYGTLNGVTQTDIEAVAKKIPVYTEGKTYDLTIDPADPGSIDALEFDNLTNFLESKLENEFNSGN